MLRLRETRSALITLRKGVFGVSVFCLAITLFWHSTLDKTYFYYPNHPIPATFHTVPYEVKNRIVYLTTEEEETLSRLKWAEVLLITLTVGHVIANRKWPLPSQSDGDHKEGTLAAITTQHAQRKNSPMKKFFMYVGALFSVLLIVGFVWVIYMHHVGSHLDADSKAYVDEIVPKIVSHWDAKELIAESSPELKQVVSDEQFRKLCDVIGSALGPLKEYKGADGESLTQITNQGKTITAQYTIHASFAKKDATLHVRLILEGDKWELLEFNVNPDL